jgi:hypothetical protein
MDMKVGNFKDRKNFLRQRYYKKIIGTIKKNQIISI